MSEPPVSTAPATAQRLNVADRLADLAARLPATVAVACPRRFSPGYGSEIRGLSHTHYATVTFAELDEDATRLARGLVDWGVPAGARLALLVRPGIEFVTLVFALLRAGVVTVLVDPGLGRRNMIRCLGDVEPEGFIGIGAAQAVRTLLRRKFPSAKWNVTVGRRWFWGGLTLEELRDRGGGTGTASAGRQEALAEPVAHEIVLPETCADDPAAIIFTSGSTGPPKGVLYTQRMFDTQVAEIRATYGIRPGGVDLACFPLFALFNAALGVTTVLPEMDFARPASADPAKLLAAADDWQATQAFASPAVWRELAPFCRASGRRIESLRQVFSCGAPVAADVLEQTLAVAGRDARMHTPYGATECLPVATIEADEVLAETAARTDEGAGVCVGRKFDSIQWRVIRITDEPIATIDDAEELPAGEIGELVVRGPQASPCYVTQAEANTDAKIEDTRAGEPASPTTPSARCPLAATTPQSAFRNPQSAMLPWHRMGDVGYLDDQGRFWYCGRKAHRVTTAAGTMFTICCEAVFNTHDDVARTALVGVGPRSRQAPVLVVEPSAEMLRRHSSDWSHEAYHLLLQELRTLGGQQRTTRAIEHFLLHKSLPVDVRHNAKIFREQLADWAAAQLPELS